MFDDFDREILVSHLENLKVAEYRFLCLRVTIDFYTEEVALVLPVQLTLGEEVSKSQEAVLVCSPTSDTLNRFF